jgi:TetR/AcrR family transcriptional regulator, cholesterol catabolism regulator
MSDIGRKRERATAASNGGYARRRRAIIDAAAEVFRAKGLAKTSVNDISARLGVDRASVYYYFKSKHHVFQAVILDSIEAVVGEAGRIAGGTAPYRARTSEIITRVTRAFADHYPALHVYLQEDMRRLCQDGDPEAVDGPEAEHLAALADTYMATLEDLVAGGIEAGEFRPIGDPHVIALVMQGTINWMHRWFIPQEGPTADEIAHVLVEILMDGLATRPASTAPMRSAPAAEPNGAPPTASTPTQPGTSPKDHNHETPSAHQ